jgi:pyruvate dehydrogenase E1 component beta subunit
VGAELSARITEETFDYLDAPVVRVAGLDSPIPYNINQERLACPDEKDIVDAAHALARA